jgi:nucleotide-binding universal stress UspA family protein
MFRTILVPLDGSEVAASILEQVMALARSHGARLLLLTVGLPLPTWRTRAGDILIVINSRGGEGSLLPFLGSVAAKVASAAAVPVLVLHAPADARAPK